MGTIRYFAYGSNMLTQRLKMRCKSARVTGCAWADGYDVVFHKSSKDGSGKATLSKSERHGARAYGVLFEITGDERSNLDRAEGDGYERVDAFQVQIVDQAEPISVTTYIARPANIDTALLPYDWYVDLVIKGAEQAQLPDSYIEQLKGRASQPDPDPERPAHIEARALLQALGGKP